MTMKRITLSVLAASMLFGTDLMAARESQEGNLTIVGTNEPDGINDKITIAQELISAAEAGADVPDVDLNNMDTNNDGTAAHMFFKVKADGSGTVSDPLFKYTIPGNVDNIDDAVIAEYKDGSCKHTVAKLSDISHNDDDNTTISFEGDDNENVYDGRTYVIVDDNESCNFVDVNTSIAKSLIGKTVEVKLYSTSGTEEEVTHAEITPFEEKAQYSFKCDSQLDGMINFENSSKSFVATGHGIDKLYINNPNNAIDGISDVNSDAFTFTVTNDVVANDIEFDLDGNGSVISLVSSSAKDHAAMFNALDNDDSVLTKVEDGSEVGSFSKDVVNKTISFEFNTTIPAGETRYTASLTTDHSAALLDTTWHAGVVLDNEDSLTQKPRPAGNPDDSMIAGQWKDYVYIAQIPGAEDGGVDKMKTKFFITNRSCKAVAPAFTVIKGGVLYTASNVHVDKDTEKFEIAANAQEIFTLKDILSVARDSNGNSIPAASDSQQVAVEITIPGNAEDFYIYAQVKNVELEQFKDLPVYSTSTRTN